MEDIERTDTYDNYKTLYVDYSNKIPVVALVIKSHSCGGSMWTHLNNHYSNYGKRPVKIIVEDMEFSKALIVKHKPDILILSNPAGANYQYTKESMKELVDWATETKKVRILGTFCVFYHVVTGGGTTTDHR